MHPFLQALGEGLGILLALTALLGPSPPLLNRRKYQPKLNIFNLVLNYGHSNISQTPGS